MSIVIQQIYKSVSQCRIFYVDFQHTRVTSSQIGRRSKLTPATICFKQQHTFFLETSFTLLYCYNTYMKVSIQTLLLCCVPGRLQYVHTQPFATAFIHKKAHLLFHISQQGEEVIFAYSMRMSRISHEHSHWSIPLLTDGLILPADWSLYFVHVTQQLPNTLQHSSSFPFEMKYLKTKHLH